MIDGVIAYELGRQTSESLRQMAGRERLATLAKPEAPVLEMLRRILSAATGQNRDDAPVNLSACCNQAG